MTVVECQRRMTWREYLTWQQYLNDEYEVPDRGDFYLMQLAAMLDTLPHRVWGKRVTWRVKAGDYQIKFDRQEAEPKSVEEATRQSQSRWFAVTGYIDGR